jgi:hypothetical protein
MTGRNMAEPIDQIVLGQDFVRHRQVLEQHRRR